MRFSLMILSISLCSMGFAASDPYSEGKDLFYGRHGKPTDYAQARIKFEDAAREGSAPGRRRLAQIFESGWGLAVDTAEALRLYREAAEGGDFRAQARLAQIYERGEFGVNANLAEAFRWYSAAIQFVDFDAQHSTTAQQRIGEVLVRLGLLYQRGQEATPEYRHAEGLFRQAMRFGNSEAPAHLGLMYEMGWGVSIDLAHAEQLYRNAILNNCVEGQVRLASLLFRRPEQRDEALQLYRQAADRQNEEAILALIQIAEADGWSSIGFSTDEALAFLRRAFDAGHPQAMLALGNFYNNGQGNSEEALYWFIQAGDAGLSGLSTLNLNFASPAETWRRLRARGLTLLQMQDALRQMQNPQAFEQILGSLYFEEAGIHFNSRNDDYDYTAAFSLYREAAHRGVEAAWFRLVFLYENDLGIPTNPRERKALLDELLAHYTQLARQGDRPSQRILASLYAMGEDDEEAIYWLILSGDNGEPDPDPNFTVQSFLQQRRRKVGTLPLTRILSRLVDSGRLTEDQVRQALFRGSDGSLYAEIYSAFEREELKQVQTFFQTAIREVNGVSTCPATLRQDLEQAYAQTFVGAAEGRESIRQRIIIARRFLPGYLVRMGITVEYGNGEVSEDKVQAFRFYRMAAEMGHAEGQLRYAWMLENGSGTSTNYPEALRNYRLAVEQGHPVAINNLAVMYLNGRGVAIDNREASRLLQIAVQRGGDDRTRTNLAYNYERGLGLRQDDQEAMYWYIRGSRCRDSRFADFLKKLDNDQAKLCGLLISLMQNQRLTHAEISEALRSASYAYLIPFVPAQPALTMHTSQTFTLPAVVMLLGFLAGAKKT